MQTTVAALSFHAIDTPLREPFGIAGGAHAVAKNVLVALTLADGTVGYGEAAPLPAYNGETQAAVLDALEGGRAALEGVDARQWRRIARGLREPLWATGSACAAIEVALLDALAKARGISFHTLFGGSASTLTTDVTIPTGTAEAAYDAAKRWSEAGFSTLKVKIGGGAIADDLSRLVAVREGARQSRITLDANASLAPRDAVHVVKQLAARGIDVALFEQPTAKGDWDALFEVARHVPVAADESVVTAADALVASRLGAPHAINVKLMKAGLLEAIDVIAVGRAAGMRLMIGGNVETILNMTVSASLAAGQGGFDFVDLDTPMFLADNPFRGGFRMAGETLVLDDVRGGHGVEPR
ncbi:MAG TPA: dipeptide epimerase [Polyangiaceae bacterium]|nr:dipeptide epimerase [Polyangiaceae bacterium]